MSNPIGSIIRQIWHATRHGTDQKFFYYKTYQWVDHLVILFDSISFCLRPTAEVPSNYLSCCSCCCCSGHMKSKHFSAKFIKLKLLVQVLGSCVCKFYPVPPTHPGQAADLGPVLALFNGDLPCHIFQIFRLFDTVDRKRGR